MLFRILFPRNLEPQIKLRFSFLIQTIKSFKSSEEYSRSASKIPIILIQNKYVHKLSQLGKNIRLEKDFKYEGSDRLHLMKKIFCHDTGILGVLLHYYNIQ